MEQSTTQSHQSNIESKDIEFLERLYRENLTQDKNRGLVRQITGCLFCWSFFSMLTGSLLCLALEYAAHIYNIPVWIKLCAYTTLIFPLYLSVAAKILAISERFFLFNYFSRWPAFISYIIIFVCLVFLPIALFVVITQSLPDPLPKTYFNSILCLCLLITFYLFTRLWPLIVSAFIFNPYKGIRIWFKSGVPASWFMTGRPGTMISHRFPVLMYSILIFGFFVWINIIKVEPLVLLITFGIYIVILFPWIFILIMDRSEALRLYSGLNRDAFYLDVTNNKIVEVKPEDVATTPLHESTKMGDSAAVMTLIEQGADINARDGAGLRPLHIACKNGFYEIVQTLIQHHAVIKTDFEEKISVLQCAAIMGYTNIAEYLLSHGAQMDLFSATALGRLEDVRKIIRNNPTVIHQNHDLIGGTCLHCAVLYDQSEILEELITQGGPIDSRDTEQNTPLMLACCLKRTGIARTLIDHGANSNAINVHGKRALSWAIETENTELVKYLREKGAKR